MATTYQKSSPGGPELIALTDKIVPILEQLPPGMTLIAENLFDHTEWQSMTAHERRQTGEMLAVLVTYEMLPLTFLQTEHAVQRYIKTAS